MVACYKELQFQRGWKAWKESPKGHTGNQQGMVIQPQVTNFSDFFLAKKIKNSIVKKIVIRIQIYVALLTQVTFELSSFLFVSVLDLHEQIKTWAKSAWGTFLPSH